LHNRSPEASWHTDYRDTAFINFGGLPYELTEGDIITIFSQYGEPVFLKLARDKETGKSKGFGWLKYEDQRSCDLAVDNIGGAEIAGRLVRVDHARYKARDEDDPEEFAVGWEDILRKQKTAKGDALNAEEDEEDEEASRRPMIREEMELQKLIEEHDDDDPMKDFLVEEKKREVQEALRKGTRPEGKKDSKYRHRHKRHHRSGRGKIEDQPRRDPRSERHRRDKTPLDDSKGHDRDQVSRRRMDRSREGDRVVGRRSDAYRRHLEMERYRNREDRGHSHGRDEGAVDGGLRRHEAIARNRDRGGDRRSRQRSRTRSPG
jgi:RNA-binding motif X-linked protein 2